jgi:hypothetical protein
VHLSHPTGDPILIEESICEDSGQNMCWKTGHAATGRDDDASQRMPVHSVEVLPFDLDIDCLEAESDSLPTEDQNVAPPHEHESSPHSPTQPHHTIVPPYAGPAKEQEGNLESDEEDNADNHRR